jgi:hypothetical protein
MWIQNNYVKLRRVRVVIATMNHLPDSIRTLFLFGKTGDAFSVYPVIEQYLPEFVLQNP